MGKRTCNNPAPKNGGANCAGSWYTYVKCNTKACVTKVNGGWSSWVDYTRCSKTCGTGYHYKKRTCNNPAPKNGGANCPGSWYKYTSCNTKSCGSTINFGQSVTNRGALDEWSNAMYIWELHRPISHSGTIKQLVKMTFSPFFILRLKLAKKKVIKTYRHPPEIKH